MAMWPRGYVANLKVSKFPSFNVSKFQSFHTFHTFKKIISYFQKMERTISISGALRCSDFQGYSFDGLVFYDIFEMLLNRIRESKSWNLQNMTFLKGPFIREKSY